MAVVTMATMTNDEKLNDIHSIMKRLDFKVDRCIVDGLLNDNNELLAKIDIIRSSWRMGQKPLEAIEDEILEVEKLWGQYVDIKDKFELNCRCDKTHK